MATRRGIEAGKAFVRIGADDSDMVKGFKRATNRLRRFGMMADQVGNRLLKLGALMAAPLVIGTRTFMAFQRQMAMVSTMLKNPQVDMARFTAGVEKMSVQFGQSTEAMAGGLFDILSASISAADAMDVLAVSAKAAVAGFTDTKTAADVITTVLNSYSLAAKDAASVSDLLFTISARGKTTFAQLAPQMGRVAATASKVGIDLETMGAALATLTRNGLRTEQAITALDGIMRGFIQSTPAAAALAKNVGFELSAAALKAEGLESVFRRIKDLPADTLAKLFSGEAIKGVLPALAGFTDFSKDIQLMANRAGATEEAFQKMAATTGFAFDQMKEAATGAMSAIGEGIGVALKDTFIRLRAWTEGARDWIKVNAGAVRGALKLTTVVLATAVAFKVVGAAALVSATAVKAWFLANPATAAIVAFVALATALGVFSISADVATESAESLSRAAGKLRIAETASLARLQELAQKQKLNANEMAEAKVVASALAEKYGDLGIAIDAVTDSVVVQEAAWQRLLDAQRPSKIKEMTLALEGQLEALEANKEAQIEEIRPARQHRLEQEALRIQDDILSITAELVRLEAERAKASEAVAAAEGRIETKRTSAVAQTAAEKKIEELKLKLQFKGTALQVKLLDLAHRRAMAEAIGAGFTQKALDKMQERFELEKQLLLLRGAGGGAAGTVVGTFNPAAANRMGSQTIETRNLKANEDTATGMKQLVSLARQGGLSFA